MLTVAGHAGGSAVAVAETCMGGLAWLLEIQQQSAGMQQVNLVDSNDPIDGLWSPATHLADVDEWSVIVYES